MSEPIRFTLRIGAKIVHVRIEDDGDRPPAELPRDHSPDFRSVRWPGRAEPFKFTPMQAAVVRCLWEADEAGAPEVGVATLLEAAGSDGNRLRDLFRSHPAWGVMIIPGHGKGTYRLARRPD